MATLAQFSRNIRKRGVQVDNAATRIVKTVSKRALRALVTNTPVDKGVARSNWRVGIGGVPTSSIAAYAPGSKLGINERANASAAITAGISRIDSVSPGRGNRLRTSIFIVNNVPYIERLNEGYSKQNAPGWIERSLQEARASINNFRVFTRRPSSEDDE